MIDTQQTATTGKTLITWVVLGVVGWWLYKKVR